MGRGWFLKQILSKARMGEKDTMGKEKSTTMAYTSFMMFRYQALSLEKFVSRLLSMPLPYAR